MEKLMKGTLTPAYARDYKTADAAIADLNAGKDFVYHFMLEQGYVGLSDFGAGARLQVRYAKERKVVGVVVNLDANAQPVAVRA